MRILIDSTFNMNTTRGRQAVALATQLAQNGHKVAIDGSIVSGLPVQFTNLLVNDPFDEPADVGIMFGPLRNATRPISTCMKQARARVMWGYAKAWDDASTIRVNEFPGKWILVLVTDQTSATLLAARTDVRVRPLPVGHHDLNKAAVVLPVEQVMLNVLFEYDRNSVPLDYIADAWTKALEHKPADMNPLLAVDVRGLRPATIDHANRLADRTPRMFVSTEPCNANPNRFAILTDVVISAPARPCSDERVRGYMLRGAVAVVPARGEPTNWYHPDVAAWINPDGVADSLALALVWAMTHPADLRNMARIGAETVSRMAWPQTIERLERELAKVR